MIKVLLPLLGIGVAVAISATDNGRTVAHDVSGHRFNVPADYLFEATIPWLPASRSGSFVFLLAPNPEPNRIPEHRILVEDLGRICASDASSDAAQILRIACGQEVPELTDQPPYAHIKDPKSSWSSGLFVVGSEGSRRQIAYCQMFQPNPAKPKSSTLCTTFWAYKGMSLLISFDLNEAAELPTMKAKAMQLLDQWEVR
ncbi:MAG: hypothetical protein ACTHLU_02450 [Novosphingobium sp.]